MRFTHFLPSMTRIVPVAVLSFGLFQTVEAASVVGSHRVSVSKKGVFGIKVSGNSATAELASAAQRVSTSVGLAAQGGTLAFGVPAAATLSAGAAAIRLAATGTYTGATKITGVSSEALALLSKGQTLPVLTLNNGLLNSSNVAFLTGTGGALVGRVPAGLTASSAGDLSAGGIAAVAAPVPEPSVIALAGLSLTGLLALRRRR